MTNDPADKSWIDAMDPSHKFHNASDKYRTMQRFVTEICTHVHISITQWCIAEYETADWCIVEY